MAALPEATFDQPVEEPFSAGQVGGRGGGKVGGKSGFGGLSIGVVSGSVLHIFPYCVLEMKEYTSINANSNDTECGLLKKPFAV